MKLDIINAALAITGNHRVQVEYEDSPEWTVASSAFDRWLPTVLARHNWNFADGSAILQRLGDSPLAEWEDEYAMPVGCLHLKEVRAPDSGVPVPWKVHDGAILVNSAIAPQAVFVRAPPYGQWPPLFIEVMTLFVEAGIYRGLHEDEAQSERREARAEGMLAEARSRSDAQNPPRSLYRSRMGLARGRRRV